MTRLWSVAIIGVMVTAVTAQQPTKRSAPTTTIMIAAVSRDKFMLNALTVRLTDVNPWTREGTAVMEPLGQLAPSGKWSGLPCSSHTPDTADGPKKCLAFERHYLSKPHVYTVISADGNSAVVHAGPTHLGDCYDYGGRGTYSGAAIQRFAIAASAAKYFAESAPAHPLTQGQSVAVYKALKALVPKELDTTKELRLFGVQLESHKMIVIQRAFPDLSNKGGKHYDLAFGIGTVGGGEFHLLYWKNGDGDEQESMLGTIALKNGRQFLVTVTDDSEGHWYRVYGIRAGHLALIYTGGGSSC
jgi:hypothetical protein